MLKLSDFDFLLSESQIAAEPVNPRDHSRLLSVTRNPFSLSHHRFYEISELLVPGDLLVFNDTRVFPARVFVTHPEKGKIETLLLHSDSPDFSTWNCLVKPGKKIKSSLKVNLADGSEATVVRNTADTFQISFPPRDNFFAWVSKVGVPPLPPYIKREANQADFERYQTVYAKENGSVAAPTAGLHFTEPLLQKLKAQGVLFASLTLHVGYGTFSPIKTENVLDHKMHEEWYTVPKETLKAIEETRARKNRVIAVGTTSLRALESVSASGCQGKTSIFITPGYVFRQVDGLITNFHLPQSSLFFLVSALMGKENAKNAYAEAIAQGYRFYSYGDAMFIQ